jgi:acetylornithine deacetylase
LGERLDPKGMLERLVGFDTTSAKSNLPLIEWVRDYLDGWGIESRLVHDASGEKANLFATLAGGDGDGGIVLSGHSDVVPVAGQDWSSDPFALEERHGQLYGRGTADMKGFIALALARVPDIVAAEPKLPIHLALSFDEEVGCIGVPHLLEQIGKALPQPAVAIIGEPTSMRVVDAHKGICALRTTVTGLEAHSSRQHKAVSAVVVAAELITEIQRIMDELRAEKRDEGFDPPFTTFNIGRIDGGTAVNIVPRHCMFEWEFRPVPSVVFDDVLGRVDAYVEKTLLPRMREIFPKAAIATEVLAQAPPLVPGDASPAVSLAMRLTGANRTDTVSFAAEAGHFQGAGMSAVICGPGDIAQAHQPDEFITLEQFEAGGAFLDDLIRWAAEDGKL